MRRAILGDEVLLRESYHVLRAAIERLGATFTAKVITRRGADRVNVEGGEVSFDKDDLIMNERELKALDEKVHWARILEACKQAGFSPVDSA
jgi:hypothetical protein